MWFVEHTIDTTAEPEAVWRLWADVASWPEWNSGVQRAELVGPFTVGSRIVMTPPGDDPVELVITEANEPGSFVDAADGGDFVVTTFHRAERLDDGRTRITYRM